MRLQVQNRRLSSATATLQSHTHSDRSDWCHRSKLSRNGSSVSIDSSAFLTPSYNSVGLNSFHLGALRHLSLSASVWNEARKTDASAASSPSIGSSNASVNSATTENATRTVSENTAVTSTYTTPSVEATTSGKEELVLDFIPDKPAPIQMPASPMGSEGSAIQYVGDPPLDLLGLGSWWPSGRVQVLMEWIHSGLDVPWWGTILISK